MTIATPGPGTYLTQYDQLYKKPPRAVMGYSQRPDIGKQVLDTPGPSNYLPKIDCVKSSKAKWTIKTSTRYNGTDEGNRQADSQSPGPGSYETQYLNSSEKRGSPNAFIAARFKQDSRLMFCTPSPLEYRPSVNNTKKRGPNYSIGT